MLGPLTANVCLAQLLLQTALNENQRKMINSILASSQLVIFFTNDLVDNNFIEHGTFKPRMEFGFPHEAVDHVIKIVSGDLESKKLECELLVDSVKDWRMDFDKQRLQQVVLNLLRNAIKFTPTNHGDITLEMSLEHHTDGQRLLKVSVKDNGIGISEDDLQNIFKPYFKTKEKQS